MISLEKSIAHIENELDDLEPGTLTANVNYRDLESWSSMYALIIIAFVDSEFDVTLTGDDLRNCNTITDLHQLVKNRS